MQNTKVRRTENYVNNQKDKLSTPNLIIQKIPNPERESTLYRIIPVECRNQKNRSRYGRNLRLTL